MSALAATAPAKTSLLDRKPFYTLLTVTGFGFFILAGLIMLLLSAVDGTLAEGGVFAAFFLVPGLVGVILPWRFGRWGFILPVLLALALLAMFAPFLGFSLAHPEAGPEFIMVVLFLAGAAMGIVGGVVSIVRWLRKAEARPAGPGEVRVLQGILGAVIVVAVISLALFFAARAPLPAEATAGTTAVPIRHFAFTADTLTVAAGQTVRIAVANGDTSLHTFTLDEAGVDVSIAPGAEKVIEFTAPASGTYTWYCVPHSGPGENGREGMVGTLVVK
jgi:plastocyanin